MVHPKLPLPPTVLPEKNGLAVTIQTGTKRINCPITVNAFSLYWCIVSIDRTQPRQKTTQYCISESQRVSGLRVIAQSPRPRSDPRDGSFFFSILRVVLVFSNFLIIEYLVSIWRHFVAHGIPHPTPEYDNHNRGGAKQKSAILFRIPVVNSVRWLCLPSMFPPV